MLKLTQPWLPLLLLILLTPPTLEAQHRIFEFRGQTTNAGFGRQVGACGDVNRDGVTDFAIVEVHTPKSYVRVFSGRDGRVLWTFPGMATRNGQQQSVDGAGDIDGDGHADVVVGSPGENSTKGAIRVYSGKTGKILLRVNGTAVGDGLGVAVAGVGDTNRDGVPDLFVGADQAKAATGKGYALLVSGKTGKTIPPILRGMTIGDRFGLTLDGVGDIDGDRAADIIVSAPRWGNLQGYVQVYSGRSRKILFQYKGTTGASIGYSVSGVGDMNRDGTPDFAIGALGPSTTNSGFVLVISGKTGKALFSPLVGKAAGDRFGRRVSSIGDVNGDGRADLLVGADQANTFGSGYVKLFSGKDLSLIHKFSGSGARDMFGESIAALGDVNGDGKPDFVVGAGQFFTGKGYAGVLSTSRLNLTTDSHAISATKGGIQKFLLDAGLNAAKAQYWLLGSVTGIRPGIPLGGGLLLPLNFDGYLTLTLTLANQTPFTRSAGKLDSFGKATAILTLPPGLPRGLLLHHAFVLYTPTKISLVSNAVVLRLQ